MPILKPLLTVLFFPVVITGFVCTLISGFFMGGFVLGKEFLEWIQNS